MSPEEALVSPEGGLASPEEAVAPPPDPNPQRPAKSSNGTIEAQEAPPPLPGDQPTQAWQNPKVQAARSACAKMLSGLDLDYEQLDPIKKGLCGTPAPIRVTSIGKDPAVAVSPPATMTCNLAVALHAWFKDTVQPSAAEFGTSVVKIRNASSYKCRNRYGRTDTKISEHALANALDISEFAFASGQRVKLLGNWPYGALSALPLKPEPPVPNPHRIAGTPGVNDGTVSDETSFGRVLLPKTNIKTNPFLAPVLASRPAGGSAPGDSARAMTPPATVTSNPFVSRKPINPASISPVPNGAPKPKAENVAQDREDKEASPPPAPGTVDAAAFLKHLHTEACKTFETVLGPDTNAAHKDHFHLDMKKRRYVKICE